MVDKKRINIEVTEEMHRDLKLAAFMTGQSLKGLLVEVAKETISKYQKEIKEAKDKAQRGAT